MGELLGEEGPLGEEELLEGPLEEEPLEPEVELFGEPVEELVEEQLGEEKAAVEEQREEQPEGEVEAAVEGDFEAAIEEVVEKNLVALSPRWEIHLCASCHEGYYWVCQHQRLLPLMVRRSPSGSFPTPSRPPPHQLTGSQPPYRHLQL